MILVCLLAFLIAMPLSSVDAAPVYAKLEPIVSDFTSEVSYAEPEIGKLEFSDALKTVSIDFIGKDAGDKDVLPDAIEGFKIVVDSSTPDRYKWSYEFVLPDDKFVLNVWVSGETAEVLNDRYVLLDGNYFVSFDDVLAEGFSVEVRVSDSRTALFIVTKDWASAGIKVGDVVKIDPTVTKYPHDGFIGLRRTGSYVVDLDTNPMTLGNIIGVGDNDWFYRILMRFNTSVVEPWDTIINATFWARVSAKVCGSGSSRFWLQNISDYGTLGIEDWNSTYQNISIFFYANENLTGWYSNNVTNWIVKGGFTAYRLVGTYENYDGVDCYINVNSNESIYEPYVEVWWNDGVADTTPPNVTIVLPQNITYYDVLTLPLNVFGADANNITAWKYSLNDAANVTFTPNTTFVPAEGSNKIIVWAQDFYGNWGSNTTYFTFVNNAPNITIIEPQNATYFHCPIDLLVSASENISSWLYQLDSHANVSFVPNTTISVSQCGASTLRVCANDTSNKWGCSSVTFTVTYMVGNDTLDELVLYYLPFAYVGIDQLIRAAVIVDGLPYNTSGVDIYIDNSTAYMIFNVTIQAYEVIWIPSDVGVYNFTVTAFSNINNLTSYGSIEVFDSQFCVNISLWTNVTMPPESRYKNEFAWIYAVRQLDPTLKVFFGKDKFACPPQGADECAWHGEYINGTSQICFNEPANYTYYIIGNNILFEQDIGSGYFAPCEFCQPRVIKQTMLYPLGTYYHDSSENMDLYINPTELGWGGGGLGWLTSGIWWVIMGIITVVFFFIVLAATGSLKAALAALIILPTLITLFISVIMYG